MFSSVLPVRLFALVLLFTLGTVNVYSQQEGDNPLQDVFNCKKTDDQTIGTILNQLPEMLKKGYGEIAADSIKAFVTYAEDLQRKDKFIVKATQVAYKEDTASYNTWLSKLFNGAKSKGDSIDFLCKWIAENYVFGESEEDVRNLNVADFYQGVRDGRLYGDAGKYAMFLSKVSQSNPKWNWGYPVIMSSEPDRSVKGAGKKPQHTWVGFSNDTGFIWCVADAFIGSIVRDRKGNVLSYDTTIAWLKNAEQANNISVAPVKFSKQLAGPCVFGIMLRSNKGLQYYQKDDKSPVITKGEWFTFLEKGSMTAAMTAPYWKAIKLPTSSACNSYTQLTECNIGADEAQKLQTLIVNKYKAKVNLTD